MQGLKAELIYARKTQASEVLLGSTEIMADHLEMISQTAEKALSFGQRIPTTGNYEITQVLGIIRKRQWCGRLTQ